MSSTNAEDAIEIIALDGDETVPAGACNNNCLVTRDFSPLDPGVVEFKNYLPNVGRLLEEDPDTDNRVELISSTLLP